MVVLTYCLTDGWHMVRVSALLWVPPRLCLCHRALVSRVVSHIVPLQAATVSQYNAQSTPRFAPRLLSSLQSLSVIPQLLLTMSANVLRVARIKIPQHYFSELTRSLNVDWGQEGTLFSSVIRMISFHHPPFCSRIVPWSQLKVVLCSVWWERLLKYLYLFDTTLVFLLFDSFTVAWSQTCGKFI